MYIFSGSKVIAEYVGGSLSKEYIYAGSQLVASLTSSGTPTYVHPDHLSARLFTDSTGQNAGGRGHFPFGEVLYESGTTDKWKFTTYERDSESGLDYAMFRFDSPRLGRFQSPDPLHGSIADPQSLNRYSYVLNDPCNLIDPLGLTANNPGCTWDPRTNTLSCPFLEVGGGGGQRQPLIDTETGEPGGAQTTGCQGSVSLGPIDISASFTLLIPNLATTGAVSGVVGFVGPVVNLGISADFTIWGPAPGTPFVSPYVGYGRHLSVGTNLTKDGPKGINVSIGLTFLSPPVGVQAPILPACNPED